MRFTDSPFEELMQEIPRFVPVINEPPENSVCHECGYWNSVACIGTCYRELMMKHTSDCRSPMCAG